MRLPAVRAGDGAEQNYHHGETHPRCRIPDSVVNMLRDLHEGPLRLGRFRLHELFPEIPPRTIDKIIHYTRRRLTRPTPIAGPSDEQRGTE